MVIKTNKKLENELKECTFKPKLDKNSMNLIKKSKNFEYLNQEN